MPTAAFYRERAVQAQRDADQATLDNVRERHLVARDTWNEMADKAEGVMFAREKQEAEKLAIHTANALISANESFAQSH
jgi:hypothetical protein